MILTLTTGTLFGSYFVSTADTSDTGRDPDLSPITADVVFTPDIDKGFVEAAQSAGVPIGLVAAPIPARLQAGILVDNLGVADVTLHTFVERPLVYRVEFRNVTYLSKPLPGGLKTFSFTLPASPARTNLAEVQPYTSSSHVGAASIAIINADRAVNAADDAEDFADDAEASKIGAQTARTDTEAIRTHVAADHAHIHLDVTHVDAQVAAAAGSAGIATTKAVEASTSAGIATTKATEAAQSRADTLTYRNTAQGSAATATTQAGISTTQAGISTAQAAISTTKAGEAAASALTLAQRVETGTKEIAYGQDGRPYLIDTPSVGVPLTVDTSVGTRVFLGDVMIHGDTGWRDVISLRIGSIGSVGRILIRRSGSTVEVRIQSPSGLSGDFLPLPSGFTATALDVALGAALGTAPLPHSVRVNGSSILALPHALTLTGSGYAAQLRFTTSDPWPTSLPGTAA